MSAGKRRALRLIIVVVGLLLALIVVGPVLAQDGITTDALSGNPDDLNDVAVRLMPLLVGAALIERGLEVLFNFVERSLLDASHSLNQIAARITGLVQVDFRQAWENLDELTSAMLRRKSSKAAPFEGDADSHNPTDWPLAMLESRLLDAQKTLDTAESVLAKAIKSPSYVGRKKMASAWLSMGTGIVLALVANLRLFEPLGVSVANNFEGSFDKFDLVLAGMLMGMGTEWVHQVIGILIKSKGYLDRAGTGKTIEQIDPEQVRLVAEYAVKDALEAQIGQVRDQLTQQVEKTIARPDSPPN
ncbi:MAG: hypothetical protein JW966_08390 [Anaerolineae bacterium]|nr:hypothetical protein [Anaerolineae bacterium]